MGIKRVLHLMRKELLELKQDPRLFGIVILAPIIQLNVLGYAATTDVKDIPIAIVDADRSTASRDLIHRFETSANFKIVAMPGSTNEIDSYLDRGDAWMAISIPPDYGRKVAGTSRIRRRPPCQVRRQRRWCSPRSASGSMPGSKAATS